jgi:transcriptional regulator with XRE-family HTH domain
MLFDGERIVELRTQRAWTQEQLAEAAGVSARTIQRLEQGESSFHTLQAVAKAFNVRIEDLKTPRERRGAKATRPNEKGGFLPRLETGRGLLAVVNDAHAYSFDHPDPKDHAEVELVGRFLQLLHDYGEISDDLDPGRRVEAAYELQGELESLHAAGLWAFGASVMQRYRVAVGGKEDIVPMRTAVVRLVRKDDPTIIKAPTGAASVYRPDQKRPSTVK